jgi:hypothetical protein
MRLSLAAASLAISVALLAGCSSSSQGGSALPNSGVGQSYAHGGGFHGKPEFPHGPMRGLAMLKWWASGKMPGPASQKRLQALLKYAQERHIVHVKIQHDTAAPNLWAENYFAYGCTGPSSDEVCGYGVELGQSKKGTTVNAIYAGATGCAEGIGAKPDHAHNLWLACGYTFTDNSGDYTYYDAGGATEYNGTTGAPMGQYNSGCTSNLTGCESADFYGFGYDTAVNTKNVFVSDEYFEYYTSATGYVYGTGWQYWPNGTPGSPTGTINVYGYQDSDAYYVYDVGYFDLDSSGNIWTYFYGCKESTDVCGTGIAEVSSPTTTPTFSVAIDPGTIPDSDVGDWGGVYINPSSQTLNVDSSGTRDTYQYKLPVTTSSSPFNTLGPTPINLFGCGEPIVGSFSKGDKDYAIADACNWLDIGNVSHNTWKTQDSLNFAGSMSAATYVKSDK